MTRLGLVFVCAFSAACDAGDGATESDWDFNLPAGFPVPHVPADNPMNAAKVELGRRLFYDERLSGNQTQACASCHIQANAFTERLSTSIGSTGEHHFRNAMSLTNVAYNVRQTWANPRIVHLEQQALLPMLGETPVELGLAGHEAELIARFAADPVYADLFPQAFPGARPAVTLDTIVKAIAAFERTLVSADSPYDRYVYGHDPDALSPDAQAGMALFSDERLGCFHCHGEFNFAGEDVLFFNTGLYDVDGKGSYPMIDQGLIVVTGRAEDMGHFRPPTLRNVALTAPYMHDGSIATLDAVIDHYAAGGRLVTSGPNAGDGRKNPFKSAFVKGFTLAADERRQLLAFLEALTDTDFVTDPRFANPWPSE